MKQLLLNLVILLVATSSMVFANEVNNQRDAANRKAAYNASLSNTGHFASTPSYPEGTRFTIMDIHPDSTWYPDRAQLLGKHATAVNCIDGITQGIVQETGAIAGWYSACFKLEGDSYEYFIFGFKFMLDSTTTVSSDYNQGLQAGIAKCKADPASCGITVTNGTCNATHAIYDSNKGEVYIPFIDTTGIFGGTVIYEIFLTQRPDSFTFDLDMTRIKQR